jgi:hypothetical protein
MKGAARAVRTSGLNARRWHHPAVTGRAISLSGLDRAIAHHF